MSIRSENRRVKGSEMIEVGGGREVQKCGRRWNM